MSAENYHTWLLGINLKQLMFSIFCCNHLGVMWQKRTGKLIAHFYLHGLETLTYFLYNLYENCQSLPLYLNFCFQEASPTLLVSFCHGFMILCLKILVVSSRDFWKFRQNIHEHKSVASHTLSKENQRINLVLIKQFLLSSQKIQNMLDLFYIETHCFQVG